MNNNFTIQKKNIKMKIKRYDVWLEQKKGLMNVCMCVVFFCVTFDY